MSKVPQTWTEHTLDICGTSLQVFKGGTGETLLLLHDEMGHPGPMNVHESLAEQYNLHIPIHPGFGKSKRLDWIMNMRDLANWYLNALEELDIQQVSVIGLSLGGWLAAEMATMSPNYFKKMVLIAPPGIKPPNGDIFDMFLVTAKEYLRKSILNPEAIPEFQLLCPENPTLEMLENWEVAREESCRLTWKPFMHYPSMPQLLDRVKTLPTLIIWGREDPIVPLSAGDAYHRSIRGSRLTTLDNCGHKPEIEKTSEVMREIENFLKEES